MEGDAGCALGAANGSGVPERAFCWPGDRLVRVSLSQRMSLRRLRLRPLSVIAAGLVIVALDFRTRSGDFLPDVVGWLLVGAGASMADVRSASGCAMVTALLSLSEFSLPYHLVRFNPGTGQYVPADTPGAEDFPLHQRWDDLSRLRGAVIAAAMTFGAVTLMLLLRALAKRARFEDDEVSVRELHRAMVAPVLWAAPFLLVVANKVRSAARYDPVWDGGAAAAWLTAVVALLGLAVLLALRRNRGWADLADAETESRWHGTTAWRAFEERPDNR